MKKKASQDTTHVSASFTMNTMDFSSGGLPSPRKQKDDSPMMTNSPVRVDKNIKKMVITNPMCLQVKASEAEKGNCVGCQELFGSVRDIK